MSQNKTIIQGVDYSKVSDTDFGELYNRSSSVEENNRTVVPDIYRQALKEVDEERKVESHVCVRLQDRPIVGVLFSVSRLSTGEVFPVYLGRNTIGSDEGCDIFLKEATVSPNHAVLLVRKIGKDDGGMIMTSYLTDYDSEYGTMIGDTYLEYEKMECQDHDLISVGMGYKFLFCLFDIKLHQMFTDNEFKYLEKDVQTKDVQKEQQEQKEKPSHYSGIISGEEEIDFYSPSKRSEEDHSTNKTVVL